MTFKEFQVLAARTLKPMASFEEDFVHMALGVNSEIGELLEAIDGDDQVNIKEELGDIMWYVAVLYKILQDNKLIENDDEDIDRFEGDPDLGLAISLLIQFSSSIANSAKRVWVYKKTQDSEDINLLVLSLAGIITSVEVIMEIFDIDYSSTLEVIINKLKKRYPEKYTDELATNRDLEAERRELEK
jgi:NTP pyrophosphatase (non-canonical NTP hydrolase)